MKALLTASIALLMTTTAFAVEPIGSDKFNTDPGFDLTTVNAEVGLSHGCLPDADVNERAGTTRANGPTLLRVASAPGASGHVTANRSERCEAPRPLSEPLRASASPARCSPAQSCRTR